MGIRYFNERDHELKMIGKYVGTLMPVIFGLYGIFGLMANYPVAEALLNIVRAVIILYPPFCPLCRATHLCHQTSQEILVHNEYRKARRNLRQGRPDPSMTAKPPLIIAAAAGLKRNR